jgi:hypothetical protein
MQLNATPRGVNWRRRQRPEQQLQRALVEHLRWRAAPDVFFFHVPNGGWRSRVEAAIFKVTGTRAGVPDLLIVRGGRLFGLELKSDRGRLSAAQKATHEELRGAGAVVETVSNIDAALALLGEWKIIGGVR